MLCPECYHDIPGGDGGCPYCGGLAPAPVGAEGEALFAGSCPWEERSRLGVFSAFGETVQGVVFAPSRFFREMPPAGAKWAALLYAAIVGTLSWVVVVLWKSAFGIPAVLEHGEQFPAMTGIFLYATLIFVPLFVVLSTIFQSAVLHVSLTFLNGARENYEATLKAVSYAASASLFMVFPFVGWPLSVVWRVVLLVIGLREVHRISTGRALLALLLPFFIVTGLMLAVALLGTWMLMRFWPEMGDMLAV